MSPWPYEEEEALLNQGMVVVQVWRKLSSPWIGKIVEFNLDVDIAYKGTPMVFPEKRPTGAEPFDDEYSISKLSGFLMRKRADGLKSSMKDGQCFVHFHFEH